MKTFSIHFCKHWIAFMNTAWEMTIKIFAENTHFDRKRERYMIISNTWLFLSWFFALIWTRRISWTGLGGNIRGRLNFGAPPWRGPHHVWRGRSDPRTAALWTQTTAPPFAGPALWRQRSVWDCGRRRHERSLCTPLVTTCEGNNSSRSTSPTATNTEYTIIRQPRGGKIIQKDNTFVYEYLFKYRMSLLYSTAPKNSQCACPISTTA